MAETLAETFARYAEDAAFEDWNTGRTHQFRFVYARRDGSVWKFTPEEWWRFVTRAINNHGAYNLPLSKQLHGRPRNLAKLETAENAEFASSDTTIRCVTLSDWTQDDWKRELSEISR